MHPVANARKGANPRRQAGEAAAHAGHGSETTFDGFASSIEFASKGFFQQLNRSETTGALASMAQAALAAITRLLHDELMAIRGG